MNIMEKEKSDYSEMFEGNAENKPARNKQIMEQTETVKAALCSNKSSTDSLKSRGCDASSSSDSIFSQRSSILAETEQAIVYTRGTVVQPSGESSYTSPKGHNHGNEFSSRSHVKTQNQHQQNTYKKQNVSHHPHQSHGSRQNQEHVKLNWDPQGNVTEQGGFPPPPRGGPPAFVRPSPPSIYAQHIPVQPYYHPIPFTDLPPPMMYHPHRMPLIQPHAVFFPSQNSYHMPSIEPPPVSVPPQKDPIETKTLNQVQEAPLKTKILNQVQYYFSEDNLPNDVYLRKHMNDEGFVHIEFIADFNKLKALTSSVQLILDSLRDSDIVEVQGYQIRNRRVWRKYVMPQDWRVTFYPSPEYVVANNYQNIQLEQN